MKAKRHDISIRELFRQKLENSEVVPGASVNAKLMRRVGRREFMRFNPSRINIWYLGGILVAVITAALLINSGATDSDKPTPVNNSAEIRKTENTLLIFVPADQKIVQQTDNSGIKLPESGRINLVPDKMGKSEKENATVPESRQNNSITQTSVKESFSKKNLYTETSTERNKLQGGYKTAESLFETSAMVGCAPLKVRFYIRSADIDSCRWTFGDGGFASEKNPEWIFDVEGEYKVVLNVFGSGGLQKTSSVNITVHPRPVASFEVSPENAVLPRDEIHFFNYSADAVHYKWNFGDGSGSELFEPRHRYIKAGNYNVQLTVSSDYGCSDSLIVLNAFSGSENFINFPNAFIPNIDGPTGGFYSSKSDEDAQVFHPVSFGVTEYQLKIFSRLGILVFESSDINIGWDGYFNGQLSNPGVYIWKVRGSFRNGEPFTKMGDVTLLGN